MAWSRTSHRAYRRNRKRILRNSTICAICGQPLNHALPGPIRCASPPIMWCLSPMAATISVHYVPYTIGATSADGSCSKRIGMGGHGEKALPGGGDMPPDQALSGSWPLLPSF